MAFVVLRPGATVTPDELIEHCRAQLARFKVPKEVTFLDALPRNPSGKVLKRELRSTVAVPLTEHRDDRWEVDGGPDARLRGADRRHRVDRPVRGDAG